MTVCKVLLLSYFLWGSLTVTERWEPQIQIPGGLHDPYKCSTATNWRLRAVTAVAFSLQLSWGFSISRWFGTFVAMNEMEAADNLICGYTLQSADRYG
ncbi:hypothetical protein EDD22DRAFT_920715 [Suillus occidentalis]|nr:hypothetical protein EDD22DRAFT_920715 [Suillus occidentalis]